MALKLYEKGSQNCNVRFVIRSQTIIGAMTMRRKIIDVINFEILLMVIEEVSTVSLSVTKIAL